jgi:hypothetical protein
VQPKVTQDESPSGQSHLIHPIQNVLEIVVIPTSFETFGMDANPRRLFLTEQIEAHMV